MKPVIPFKQWTCTLQRDRYLTADGPLCLSLVGAPGTNYEGDSIARCTVNLPGLQPDEVAVKSWSENEGMEQVLLDAGIIEPAHRHLPTGFVTASVHRLK